MSEVKIGAFLPDLTDPTHVPFTEALAQATDPRVGLQQKLNDATKQGYDDGYRDATQAAATAARETTTAVHAQLDRLVETVRNQIRDSLAAQASDLAEAAWALATWAINKELSTDKTLLTGAVDQALADLDVDTEIVVYAHPDTIEAIADWAASHTPAPLRVKPDNHLDPGELRAVASSGARVEATVAEIGRRALARLVSTVAATEEVPQ